MARLRGFFVILASCAAIFKTGFVWVGSDFMPLRGLCRPATAVQGARSLPRLQATSKKVAAKQVLQPGDRVHYVWVRPKRLTPKVELSLGDHGIVEKVLLDDEALKVRFEGRHAGYTGYVLASSMIKETLSDTTFRMLDKGCDGALQKEEARQLIGERFEKLDIDRNGKVDRWEWVVANLDEAFCKRVLAKLQ